jgi:hypothetical protein
MVGSELPCAAVEPIRRESRQVPIEFNRDIRPILSDKCFYCHGPDASHRQADLRLDRRDEAISAAIEPGQPEASELIARITSSDSDLRMPPADSGKELSTAEIELLTQWVSSGAEYEEPWAYVPPRVSPIPEVEHATWSHHWIDRLLYPRLQQAGLEPSSEADRVTLIRRLSFDLTGLPPTPVDVDAFVSDTSTDAYEKLIDRLLASPHFGERMAMYWLDLVRFADTVGYHGDQDHNISPYRDWVIDAWNDNMPFDQFTAAQLAGDLLPGATIDDKIASGYNRLLQTSHEGGVQPKEYMAIYAADRVRNVSNVWFGGTLGCAQCHDHKFDPYTTKDFYSMVAFFADVDEEKHFKVGTNELPTRRPPEIQVLSRRERDRVAALESSLAACAEESEQKAITAEITAIRQGARMTMVTEAVAPRVTRILPRGNWLDDSGEIVDPAVPEFLGSLTTGARRPTRLDLARWLTDPDPTNGIGGLTARVMVNRYWYLLLGVGLAKPLDDFGGQGEPPAHPELLDMLAISYVDSGWDTKQLIKSIVMSSAYRQSSMASPAARQQDPYNRLYSHQSSFRLPAEMVRDNALAISGLLVTTIGGASVKPYQPPKYYRHLNFPEREYAHDRDNGQWRRGVYVHWQRQFLHPMLKSMDAPSREECTAERARSNTPLAALTLMNDPSFVEAARALAARIIRDAGSDSPSRLEYAFRVALSRSPDQTEQALLLDYLERNREQYRAAPERARELLTVGQVSLSDDLVPDDASTIDLAAWTAVSRTILNMHETITRN